MTPNHFSIHALLLALLFWAAGGGSAIAQIDINNPTSGDGYSWSDHVLTIEAGGTYTITGTTTTKRIKVASGITAYITLNNMDISSTDCAFGMTTGAKVYLTLTGSNTLKSGGNNAGLHVPEGAMLEITAASSGTLTATSGSWSAGIGGRVGNQNNHNGYAGTITICGGTVTASGKNGAGIGGGSWGAATVTICGGTVTASGSSSAAIGGGDGMNSNNSTVIITGGSVRMNNHNGPQPTNGKGANGYLNTLTVGSIGDGEKITAGYIDDVACVDGNPTRQTANTASMT